MEESEKGSAGRVQSVALRLVIDRENEIRNFKPEEYWSIEGEFRYKKSKFTAKFLHYKNKPFKLKQKDVEKVTKMETNLKLQMLIKRKTRNPANLEILLIHLPLQHYNKRLVN